MTLTLPNIKNTKPGDVLRCDKVTGLQLRAFPQSKSFWLYYRTKAGKERRPKIGDFPIISLDKAREIAKGWLEIVASGKDPVENWEAEAAAPTMDDLCDRYLKWIDARKKRTRDDHDWIRRFIRPTFKGVKVSSVQHADIEDLLDSLKKTPAQANRVRACLSKMFNLAEKWKMRPQGTNPVRHTEKNRELKRKRYMRADEAPLIAERLEHYSAQYPQAVAFIYLEIFTGMRPSEVATARPDQRQGDRFEFTEHKTDGSTGEPRTVYLPPQAVAVLDRLPVTQDGTITGLKSPRHVWRKIIKDTGITNLRMYDLRHSFASAALAAGMSLEETGQLLGHQNPQTTKRYVHLMEDLGVNKATRAADFLENMMKKKEPA